MDIAKLKKCNYGFVRVEVTPAESIILQNLAFRQGYSWSGEKIIQKTHYKYIGFWEDKSITFGETMKTGTLLFKDIYKTNYIWI